MEFEMSGWYPVENTPYECFFDGRQWTVHRLRSNPEHLPPKPPVASFTPAGWYSDPWNPQGLRWWDGQRWQYHTAPAATTAPQALPAAHRPWRRLLGPWITVGICASFMLLVVFLSFLSYPLALPLVIVPASALGLALWWMDRLEPEPFDVRMLVIGWGAFVASSFALMVGLAFSTFFGEAVSAIIAAPLSEELMKGAVLVLLVRRRLIDSLIDGAMYAVAVAAGFAIIEDILYFAMAGGNGLNQLIFVFIGRGILTPFAHPLFTVWMGIAAGWVVTKRPPTAVKWVVGFLALTVSVFLHALWNGTLFASENYPSLLFVVGAFFVVLFVAAVVTVTLLRKHQAREFELQVPQLAELTGLTPAETAVFADTRLFLKQRRSLPQKQRKLLSQLRWNLHAIGSLRRVPPTNEREAKMDAAELEFLRETVTSLRKKLTHNPHDHPRTYM
jgi:protease PrsW